VRIELTNDQDHRTSTKENTDLESFCMKEGAESMKERDRKEEVRQAERERDGAK
jgi:hypothetical protein